MKTHIYVYSFKPKDNFEKKGNSEKIDNSSQNQKGKNVVDMLNEIIQDMSNNSKNNNCENNHNNKEDYKNTSSEQSTEVSNNKNKKLLSILEWADLYDKTCTLIDQAKICSGDADIYDCSKFCDRKDGKEISKIKDGKLVKEKEFRFCDKWLIRDMYKQMEELLNIITKLMGDN